MKKSGNFVIILSNLIRISAKMATIKFIDA